MMSHSGPETSISPDAASCCAVRCWAKHWTNNSLFNKSTVMFIKSELKASEMKKTLDRLNFRLLLAGSIDNLHWFGTLQHGLDSTWLSVLGRKAVRWRCRYRCTWCRCIGPRCKVGSCLSYMLDGQPGLSDPGQTCLARRSTPVYQLKFALVGFLLST